MFKGIDLSVHNGYINWEDIKNSDIKAVIIKATEGINFVDKMLENHYRGASSVGMNIGFYHFMSEKTDPKEQAKDFWGAIKNKKFNILPCLDIEVNKKGRDRTQISDRCVEFLEEFKRLSDYDCMIYTGGFFGRDLLDDRVKKYPGWIAHYGVDEPMKNGFKVVGHQYTDEGKTTGVKGDVDLNNFYDGIFINCNKPVVKPNQKPSNNELWQKSISGEEVKALQREINKQDYGNIKEDGYFGNDTLNSCPTLREGAIGNITKLMQQRLLNRGYTSLLSLGGSDGYFGSGTTTAIKNLQKNKNLSVDGIVGKNTWKALYSK